MKQIIIGMQAISELIDVTKARVDQLVASGVVKRLEKNKYDLVESVRGYIRFIRDENRRQSRSAADARVRDARTREIELRIATREGHLIELDDAMQVVEGIVGDFRSRLSGLPARCTRDLLLRRTIETACNDIIDAVAASAKENASAMAAGRLADAENGDGDAGPMGDSEPDASGIVGSAGAA